MMLEFIIQIIIAAGILYLITIFFALLFVVLRDAIAQYFIRRILKKYRRKDQ